MPKRLNSATATTNTAAAPKATTRRRSLTPLKLMPGSRPPAPSRSAGGTVRPQDGRPGGRVLQRTEGLTVLVDAN
jgi:hypothetical protein